jgi:hypothetical protein
VGLAGRLPRIDARLADVQVARTVDAVIALLLTVAALTSYFTGQPGPGGHVRDTLGAVLVALSTAPLAVLHVVPLSMFLVLSASTMAQSVLGYPLSGWTAAAACLALFLLVITVSYRRGVAAAVMSSVTLVVAFIFSATLGSIGAKITTWLAFSGAYLLGLVIKVYRENAAVAAERAALFAADREARAPSGGRRARAPRPRAARRRGSRPQRRCPAGWRGAARARKEAPACP